MIFFKKKRSNVSNENRNKKVGFVFKFAFSFLPFFVVFAYSYSAKAQITADPADSVVLVEFHTEIQAAGWPELWDASLPVQQWDPIRLDPTSGKVTGFSLRGDKSYIPFTSDSLPSCIAILQQINSLVDLNFSILGLRYLPNSLWGFKNLQKLGLGYNELAELPGVIASLNKLEILSLHSNKLKSLPDLSALSSLTYLTLSSNETLQNIPPTVFDLPNLTTLSLDYCPVGQVPEDIDKLIKLESLRMIDCNLTELPTSFGMLENLKELHLKNNRLTSLPESMGDLTALSRLDVSYNQLTTLPQSFSGLSNLYNLNFDNNYLTEFPSQVAGIQSLLFIRGENNQMEGSIPGEVWDRVRPNRVELFLNGNKLSGKLKIADPYFAKRLHIKYNQFVLSDIYDVYGELKSNNCLLEFNPQEKVGTPRTFTPEAGAGLSFGIDAYIHLSGSTYEWYKVPKIEGGGTPELVSDQAAVSLSNFDPAADAGVYYCKVSHPAMEGLELQSGMVRVIGENQSPAFHINDLVFREDTTANLLLDAQDDFTYRQDLAWDIPDATEHFNVTDESTNTLQRNIKISPKATGWIGTDTLEIGVSDEHGNTTSHSITITLLSKENSAPVIAEIPPVYIKKDGDATFWFMHAMFYPGQFISDDFDETSDLVIGIAPDDVAYFDGHEIYMYTTSTPLGWTLDVYHFSNKDTAFSSSFTLMVTDKEGGTSTREVSLVFPEIHNEAPVISEIPEQLIVKGAGQFAALNLKRFVQDDYLMPENLEWLPYPSLSFEVEMKDSMAIVYPKYADSSYVDTLTYRVSERTNVNMLREVKVVYKILEEGLIVSGSILLGETPLKSVNLKGFPGMVQTNADGYYEISVAPGWSGTVTPELANYSFDPESRTYNNVQIPSAGQDFSATYTGTYTISGSILDSKNEPMENVEIAGFSTIIKTDGEGKYISEVPAGWSGVIVPQYPDHAFTPESIEVNNMQSSLTDKNFTATYTGKYSVSGRITGNEGLVIANVVLSGFPSAVVTDETGNYMGEVPAGWTGTVTPVLEGYSFDPEERSYNNVQENIINHDYVTAVINGIGGKGLAKKVSFFPNPTTSDVQVLFGKAIERDGVLAIYDNLGQQVRRYLVQPGTTHLKWDGYNGTGLPVSPGIYHFGLYIDNELVVTEKIILIR